MRTGSEAIVQQQSKSKMQSSTHTGSGQAVAVAVISGTCCKTRRHHSTRWTVATDDAALVTPHCGKTGTDRANGKRSQHAHEARLCVVSSCCPAKSQRRSCAQIAGAAADASASHSASQCCARNASVKYANEEVSTHREARQG